MPSLREMTAAPSNQFKLKTLGNKKQVGSQQGQSSGDDCPLPAMVPERKMSFSIGPRWRVRLKALFCLFLIVLPSNLATLGIYISMPPSADKERENATMMTNGTELEDAHNSSEPEANQDDDNSSVHLTEAGYYCHERHDVVLPILDNLQFWIEGIMLTVVAIVGLLGNILTVVVLLWMERVPHVIGANHANQSSFNAILICLVTFDSFFLAFSLFDSAFVMSTEMLEEPYWYKIIFPYVWHPLKNIISCGCVFTVVAIATERYFAICRPLAIKPRPPFIIVFVILASTLISVPKFFEFRHVEDENGTLQYWTTELNENAVYVVFSSYYECAMMEVIPLLALCFLNYKIHTSIHRSTTNMLESRHVGEAEKPLMEQNPEVAVDPPVTSGQLRRENTAPNLQQCSNASVGSSGRQAEFHPLVVIDTRGQKKAKFSPTSAAAASLDKDQRLSVVASPTHHSSPSSRAGQSMNIRPGLTRIVKITSREITTRFEVRQREEFQNRKEKSTRILVGIILVFATCHIFRLCIQSYEIFSPTHGLQDHFRECEDLKRLHVPALVYVLGSVNHLLLVTNSSVNFLIYCCMARRFRKALFDLFRTWQGLLCHQESPINVSPPEFNRYN